MKKKIAFTLAEVLITIGVIGVVAAMTIPTLISNYQKRAWTAQLQKTYAVLNQGFRRMLADDNVSALSQTETFQSIGGESANDGYGNYKKCSYNEDIDSENCKNFYSNLRKYFQIAEIKELLPNDYKPLYQDKKTSLYYRLYRKVIFLSDGTMLYGDFDSHDSLDRNDTLMGGRVGIIRVDLNGIKKPNIIGRDIFLFWVGDNGIVYPYGSLAASDYNRDGDLGYWKTSELPKYMCNPGTESEGAACTARVLEEGKMNY